SKKPARKSDASHCLTAERKQTLLATSGSVSHSKMVSPKARRILFPIDRSDHSKRAIQWYLDKFAWENDALYLVHVVEPNYSRRFSEVSPDDHTSALTNKMKESVAAGEQVGAQYRSFLKERGKESEFVMQVGTKPGEQIINAARDVSADVIIIGNR
ncbi:hypothetical protein X801_08836, partial [Opisthorchis viverrini]